MFTVYILFSTTFNKTYVGQTSNLEKRIEEHNYSSTKGFTVSYRPWSLLHTEIFETRAEALKVEKYYKTGVGREFIKQLVYSYSKI